MAAEVQAALSSIKKAALGLYVTFQLEARSSSTQGRLGRPVRIAEAVDLSG